MYGCSFRKAKAFSSSVARENQPPKVLRTGASCFPWACVRLYDWILARFDSAKMKGFITLSNLRAAIAAEQGFTISKKILRRTLKGMGFTYKKRKQVWISRRLQPGVQEKKKHFLEWVVTNSEKVTDPSSGKVKC